MAGLERLQLHALHVELGGKLVPFAGYEMPVQYAPGVMKEHLHTREAAGLFDVSHMGQVIVAAKSGRQEDAAAALERLIPVDVLGLAEGRQRYGFLTNDVGGIIDDLMIANRGDHFFLVVNASRKAVDIEVLRRGLPDCDVGPVETRALIALQGPEAERVLSALVPDAADFAFMDVGIRPWQGVDLWISRSGYTGEDGFEISVPAVAAEGFARKLLADEAVWPIGLGARDSLRLEAGLCLYGHDMDEDVSPVEAGLTWAIQKVRRTGGARAGGFPGADRILRELTDGPARKRVGLRPEGRAPMREGVEIHAAAEGGAPVGRVTSGGFGPSLDAPIAMAMIPAALCAWGTTVYGDVRGRRLPAVVCDLPFRPSTYKR
ncbi:MAG: glycine cleavage system aminomethyltransferase GcvT [Paracoccaceae bacterium]|nr:glycine cleavage system aminomethyltransferase GcvT [Paracoccaceae bacterium]